MTRIFTLLSLFMLLASCTNAQVVKGKLYYDLGKGKNKNANGLILYLIPYSKENEKLIKNASRYEVSCSEEQLRAAKQSKKTISDNEGYFFFNKVPSGKYLIKVCTHYGGYYTINIRSSFKGTVELPKLEADPPV